MVKTKKYICLILFLAFILFPNALLAVGRGIKAIKVKDKQGRSIDLYKESHALIIGASDYEAGWPDLPGVVEDVKNVKEILEKHDFSVDVVMNPNNNQLTKAFDNFINRYGRKEESRLIFYWAGHGHTAKLSYGGEMGYIVPVDAPNPDRDISGFKNKAIDMQQIEVYAKRIESKHALFMFDSCFSGSIFSLKRAIPTSISYKSAKPVRQFITSGSADEQVPDESIFAKQLVAALEGDGDLNDDGYVTGDELGLFLEDTVINYSKGAQHPQSGKIRDPNLDKGDFVFILIKGDVIISDEASSSAALDIEAEKERLKEKIEALKKQKKGLEELETMQGEQKKLEAELKKLKKEKEQLEKKEPVKKRDVKTKEKTKPVKEVKPLKEKEPSKKKAEKQVIDKGFGFYFGIKGLTDDESKYFEDFAEVISANTVTSMLALGGSYLTDKSEFLLYINVPMSDESTKDSDNEIKYYNFGVDYLYSPWSKKANSFNLYFGGGLFIPNVRVEGGPYSVSASGTGITLLGGVQYFFGSNLNLGFQLNYRGVNIDELKLSGYGKVEGVSLSGINASLYAGYLF